LSGKLNDTQVWGDEELERYMVAYTCLAKHLRGTQHVNFDLLWKASAFPNVLLTAWKVLIDRIPTREAEKRCADGIYSLCYMSE